MPFLKTTRLAKLFYPIIILSLLTVSCSTDNSVTGNSDQTNLSKPSDIIDYFSEDDGLIGYDQWIKSLYDHWMGRYLEDNLSRLAPNASSAADAACFLVWIVSNPFAFGKINNFDDLSNVYDFRDNYLLKSEKGQNYIFSYYIISKYGIDNNLIMKHSMEHLSLMNAGIAVSSELQQGTNDNQILITRSTYDDLKDIMKIYRNSEYHQEIDPILDYLETDLEKYYSKTKADIAADFEF